MHGSFGDDGFAMGWLPRFSAQPSCGNNKFAAREILCGPQPLHHDCTCIVLNEMMA